MYFRRVLLGGLVAAVLTLFIPVGCTRVGDIMVDAGGWMRDVGDSTVPNARAQDTCTQWRIEELDTGVNHDSAFDLVDFTLPPGYEPMEMDYAFVGTSATVHVTVIARTCVN